MMEPGQPHPAAACQGAEAPPLIQALIAFEPALPEGRTAPPECMSRPAGFLQNKLPSGLPATDLGTAKL